MGTGTPASLGVPGKFMTCNYPNCHRRPSWIPVISLPTIDLEGRKLPDTLLLFPEVCSECRSRYTIEHCGLSEGDWSAIRDAAHEKGRQVPPPELIAIQFKPIGWVPPNHMPVDRV